MVKIETRLNTGANALRVLVASILGLLAVQPCLGQSNVLQGDTNSTMIQGGMNSTMVQGNIDQAGGPVNILFLIDASYSMKEKFGGGDRKMGAAKQVLEEAITRIPADVNLGLRVFGQSFSGAPEIDCRQTSILVPLGAHNRNGLIQAIRTIQPSGLTPLEFALRQAAEVDFAGAVGSKLIILVSDGRDTCGGDPCRFISLLPRYGIKLKVDVVGLLIHDKQAQEQLHCLAETSGGKYFDANSAGDLIQSVAHSVDKAISGKVIMKPKVPVPAEESGRDPGKDAGRDANLNAAPGGLIPNIGQPGTVPVVPVPNSAAPTAVPTSKPH